MKNTDNSFNIAICLIIAFLVILFGVVFYACWDKRPTINVTIRVYYTTGTNEVITVNNVEADGVYLDDEECIHKWLAGDGIVACGVRRFEVISKTINKQ